MEPQIIILPIIALVASGFTWTMGGYVSSWRKNHTDPKWTGFEPAKLRNDLILGGVLGGVSVLYTIFTDGTFAPIQTAQDFLIAIVAGTSVVALVDKFIIGGIFGNRVA